VLRRVSQPSGPSPRRKESSRSPSQRGDVVVAEESGFLRKKGGRGGTAGQKKLVVPCEPPPPYEIRSGASLASPQGLQRQKASVVGSAVAHHHDRGEDLKGERSSTVKVALDRNKINYIFNNKEL
jgi:hypothetical protein